MGAPPSPPPWEDIVRLLSRAAFMYTALFTLALSVVCLQRPFFRRGLSGQLPVISSLFSVMAVSGFANRYSFELAVLRMLISLAICVSYVCSTYVGYISDTLLLLRRIVGITLVVELVGKLMVFYRPIEFMVAFETLFEVLSLSSLIFAKRTDWLNFSFLQAYIIVFRFFYIEPNLELMFMRKRSPFHRQLTRLTLEFITFIYAFACGLQLFELLGDPTQKLTATTFELTFANSLYFTVVTIFTVGYGDFVPYTLLGRFWIILIIFFGAYLVSMKIGQVVDVVSGLRRGLGSFVKGEGIEHCVICGNVKWEYLKSFVQEFYGDVRNDGKKLVVICDQPNWTEETWNKFFTAQPFKDNVVYLEGTCVSRDDLIRAQVETALSVFVLNNHHNPDPYAEDSETLKRILTIRSYTPNLPIYSMCALRDSMLQITYALEHVKETEAEEARSSRMGSAAAGINLLSQGGRGSFNDGFGVQAFRNDSAAHPAAAYYNRDFSDEDDDDDGLLVPNYDGTSDLKSEAICMQEIEMALLAENVFCNGLSTLLANLILRVNPQTKPTDQPWAIEYKIGSECRFEYVRLPMYLHNKKLSEIAVIMYDYGILLIATKRFMEKKWKAVTPDTIIHLNTIGLIITFHSTNFLKSIMEHIATRVRDVDDEVYSDHSSQDVPSVDDDFSTRRNRPRYNIAGDLLTGDVPLVYDFPPDELVTQPPRVQHPVTSAFSQTPSLTAAYSPDVTVSQQAVHGGIVKQQPLVHATEIPSTATQSSIPPNTVESQPQQVIPEQSNLAELPGMVSREIEDNDTLRTDNLALDLLEDTVVNVDTSDDDFGSDVPSGSYSHYKSQLVPTKGEPSFSGAIEQTKPPVPTDSEKKDRSQVPQPENIDEILDSEDPTAAATGPSTGIYSRVGARGRPGKKKAQVSFHQKNKTQGINIPTTDSSDPKDDIPEKQRVDKYPKKPLRQPMICFGEDELPMKVKGHIVVCAIGPMAMVNLRHFLQRVWMQRGLHEGDTPVVAICPRLSEKDEVELSRFPLKRLFIIQGNSLSVKTLRRAQFEQAKAIIVLACEDKNDIDHMDAKAIFTVMTLDYLLGESSETFVCTMLDAEESMQLLRAPAHPRRKGTSLGRGVEEYLQFGVSHRSLSGYFSAQSANARTFHTLRSPGSSSDARRPFAERTFSFGALSGNGDLPRSMSFVGIRNSTYTDRKEALGKVVGLPNEVDGDAKRLPSSSSFGRYRSLLDDEEDLLNNQSAGGVSALNFLMNPSTLTMGPGRTAGEHLHGRGRGGVGHGGSRPRDELFEKQRYASGEMMISSTYTALLIREYAMPGLMAVVRKIFGAGMGKTPRSKRSWVRAIHIPRRWILESRDGRRTYREVFEVLLKYRAIALGLYRSGDVMVRVQVEVDPGLGSESASTGPNMSADHSFVPESVTRDAPTNAFDGEGGEGLSDESPTFEFGGAPVSRQNRRRAFENTRLMQDNASYGATDEVLRASDEAGEAEDEGDGASARVNLPSYLLLDVAENVEAARMSEDAMGQEDYHSYVCPTSGRTAMFKEVPGGKNVLPYVYTNPEAYTLVSEHDAVYVLVAPTEQIPDEW